jgi:hypothetical protein
MARASVTKRRREAKAAKVRARRILEIKPGSVTVYTAYAIVLFRLVVLAVHGLNLGPL